MLRYLHSAIILSAAIFTIGCSSPNIEPTSTIYVSILPLRSIVEWIVEDDFPIEVLVPAGAAVESYELTPKQYIELNRAQMVFSIGLLPFEDMILSKIGHNGRMVKLCDNVELIAGECTHSHNGHACSNHGVDPHIWTSPKELQIMALNCYNHIKAAYPDSLRYQRNYLALQQELEMLDNQCRGAILASGIKSIFIYHPALTYYARAYGIEQVAIEDEGKEPSTRRIARLIEQGRNEGVTKILYQSQFPVSTVEIVARDLGAKAVEVDPLAENAIGNIVQMTNIIVGYSERVN